MEKEENMAYVVTMLKQISKTTTTLAKNYQKLNSKIDKLDAKVDDNYQKLDSKIDKLDVKIFRNYQAIDRNSNLILSLRKDIDELREDLKAVYHLEQDSRKKIQQLF